MGYAAPLQYFGGAFAAMKIASRGASPCHFGSGRTRILLAKRSSRASYRVTFLRCAYRSTRRSSGAALEPFGELLVRPRQSGLHVGPLLERVMSLPWPAERAVEHLLDGTQGDPIVLGTDQEVEPGERSIEKLGIGRGQVFELRDVELLSELFTSAHLLSTGLTTSCAIL